jgi:Immunity protein 53
MDDLFGRLERWYAQCCDGSWEHQYGIRIESLDNPGWRLEVDLNGTPLYLCSYDELTVERSGTDWIRCRVRDGRFEGFGGLLNLQEILRAFLQWAEPDQH